MIDEDPGTGSGEISSRAENIGFALGAGGIMIPQATQQYCLYEQQKVKMQYLISKVDLIVDPEEVKPLTSNFVLIKEGKV